MAYIVTADRPAASHLTGRVYVRTVHHGVPISSPFRGDALEIGNIDFAASVRSDANRHFGGYRLEEA